MKPRDFLFNVCIFNDFLDLFEKLMGVRLMDYECEVIVIPGDGVCLCIPNEVMSAALEASDLS